MGIKLNHTIIPAHNKWRLANFLAEILVLPAGPQGGPLVPIRLSNEVALDYMDAEDFGHHHYAFLIGEAEFDAALSRLRAADIEIYADFNLGRRGQINHLYGGRGVYFHDPNGHLLELITRPYGPTPERWIGAAPEPG